MFETFIRTAPFILPSSQLLLHRLNHDTLEYRIVSDTIDATRAGFNGESYVDRILHELSHSDHLFIIPNLILQIRSKQRIEIDTLIITDRYCLILEIKALRGIVRFKTNPSFMEIEHNGKIFDRECPQIQLLRAIEGLETWLRQNGLSIPVHGFLTFAYRNVRVEQPPSLVQLTFAKELPFQIRKLSSQLPSVLNPTEVKQLVTDLKQANQPFSPYPLCNYYRINPGKLITGLICRSCGNRLTRKSMKTWWCLTCNRAVQDAPLCALEEWFMFVKPTISNEECREWLGLKDKHAASHLLTNSTLLPIGQNRARRYQLREEDRLNVRVFRKG